MNSDHHFSAKEARSLVKASCFISSSDTHSAAASSSLPSSIEPAVLVMGAFDGLHLGHRALIAEALEVAHLKGVPCRPLMFEPDPSVVLHPDTPQPQLLSCADRVRGMRALGCDEPIVLPFTLGLAALSPKQFLLTKVLNRVKPLSIHVGTNFHFGKDGAGDVGVLRSLGQLYGFEVCESQLVRVGGERVSSTRIRRLLSQGGALAEANALLGRCHMARGVIEHGRGEGTSFGFPTANVRFPARTCMPAEGVYGGYVVIGDSAWPAAINVGAPPTFSGPDELFCEANLIGFSGDIYGAEATVIFVEWLRASRRFDSTEELERVVLGNIDWVRNNLGDGEVVMADDN